jgi:uncharacterized protein (DUF885 family)
MDMEVDDSRATAQLADELLQAALDMFPVGASLVGLRDRDDRLPDYTEAGQEAERARVAAIADRATALDPSSLGDQDRVTRSVVLQQAASMVDTLAARGVEYTVTDSMFCPVIELLSTLPMIGITEPAHADGYLVRLRRMPATLGAIADRHRSGLSAGRLPVRRLVEATVAHLDRYLADPGGDPLRRPAPPAGGDVDGAGFATERDRLLAETVRPAVGRYREVLATEVAPPARPEDRPGLCWLPDGDAYYTGLVRAHTSTTDRTPDGLHRTGLEIIERLVEEYAEVGARVFGTTEVPEIFQRLRTDPAMRWRDAEELLAAARAAILRAEEAAPAWFGVVPSRRCTVEPVPETDAPGAPPAYYLPPALDGSRPGIYFANTHQAAERDRHIAEAVAFHEAVPGHHFQLTRAMELTDLPMLRRLGTFTAYNEGWGLYAERLADEMGLYSGDVARLGMLAEDSVRAARLVVDTGLHAKGWSRQRVVDYLRTNTTMSEVEINTETDRYISAPGQALAYMTGRLEIKRIRSAAERALGDRFDIRAFHDTVLGSGALPLTVLEEVVQAWVEHRSGTT